jgi:hypothetical protein
MQLLSITLYHRDGRRTRTVEFHIGELNVITGESKTGKSALLTIVEYCLGRDTMLVPAGPISDTVGWYGALWDLGNGARAFTARPAPAEGRASTQLAMLEFGGDGLTAVSFDRLLVNTDSGALREQLGRRIGIEENIRDRPIGSLQQPLEANLGHAALLCLQAQGEVANQTLLFHRQGESFVDQALRDTIPYFLGAVPRDQAVQRSNLREARRALQRAENQLATAETAAQTIDVELQALHAEAVAVGLLDGDLPTTRAGLVSSLVTAREAPAPSILPSDDTAEQDRQQSLAAARDVAVLELRRVLADRALLLEQSRGEDGYRAAIELQVGRLTSLGLLEVTDDVVTDDVVTDDVVTDDVVTDDVVTDDVVTDDVVTDDLDVDQCPACGQDLLERDTDADNIRRHLQELRNQLSNLANARPAQGTELARLDAAVALARSRLSAADEALAAIAAGDQVAEPNAAARRDFTRGRIDAILRRVPATDEVELQRLRNVRGASANTVAALEAELAANDDRELLNSRLFTVGQHMTEFAATLELEHRGPNVRLSIDQLTVLTDTDAGPITLLRIGSAGNHMGYHLATHLALHRFFTQNDRPVPRLLILDQPTQAYFPSDVAQASGDMDSDEDRLAVRRLFELIRDVVADLAPEFQVIVCDHANLPETWFQQAVRYDWRNGEKLIPTDWLTGMRPEVSTESA